MIRELWEDEKYPINFITPVTDDYYQEGKVIIKRVVGPNNRKKQYRLNRIEVRRNKKCMK
jgi:hypothetical protein